MAIPTFSKPPLFTQNKTHKIFQNQHLIHPEMLNLKSSSSPDTRTSTSFSGSFTGTSPTSVITTEKAKSFISKGWGEVKLSADADLQLIKNRANTFRNLADKELENFINSASVSALTVSSTATTMAEIKFFKKKLQPKLSEFKWTPKTSIRIDLSAIKNAHVSEMKEEQRFRKWRSLRFRDGDGEGEEGKLDELWEPIKAMKSRFKELEKKSSSEIFQGLKNSEFVEKVKSSLVCKQLRIYS